MLLVTYERQLGKLLLSDQLGVRAKPRNLILSRGTSCLTPGLHNSSLPVDAAHA
jgi:hypothetical protein